MMTYIFVIYEPNSRPLLFALLVLKIVVKMTFAAMPFLVVEAVHDVYFI